MDTLPPHAEMALPATLLLLLTLWFMARRRIRKRSRPQRQAEQLSEDSVAHWSPQATRVMTRHELAAYELLVNAMPACTVLAQVPLARFIRVAPRPDAAEWLHRVGALNVDLLLCGPDSRVLAVVDIRSAQEGERSRRRHERMERVLKAAGIPLYNWRDDALPEIQQVRNTLAPLVRRALAGLSQRSGTSNSVPLIPVGEMEEILAEGDRAAEVNSAFHDPVSSGFFDDLDLAPAAAQATRR